MLLALWLLLALLLSCGFAHAYGRFPGAHDSTNLLLAPLLWLL
jgi:hypothetical protein